MRHLIPVAPACIALLLAACNRAPEMDEQLKRDLEAASTGTIELAPSAQTTRVVSDIESKQPVQPKVTPTRRVLAPAKAPPALPGQVTQTGAEPTATRPATKPAVQPPPPGGYKTVNEVIRNAPFPIKPAKKP